jgi:hypothetical protein
MSISSIQGPGHSLAASLAVAIPSRHYASLMFAFTRSITSGLTPAGTDVFADDRALLTEAEPSSPAYELRPDAPEVPDGSVSWAPLTDVWSPDAIRMCWIFVCAAFGSVRRSTPCS